MNPSKRPAAEEDEEFVDVSIQMPWGHVAGRWYGNRLVRPLLALHGWLDNLGTWNNLLPLLPTHLGVLCIDLPGHGLSSKLPQGIAYQAFDYAFVILKIMQEYDWPKVSLLAHSMSAMTSFVFAALYPQRVDMLISIDIVRTLYQPPPKAIKGFQVKIEKYLVEDERLEDVKGLQEPPSYTWEELERKQYDGSYKSIEPQNCKHILVRNVTKSTKYPDKYYFSRDGRVKYYHEQNTEDAYAKAIAEQIRKVPYCVIKGSKSNYIDETSDEVIAVLRKNNPHFEFHELEGTHHVHLNNAAEVAAVINPFINRHRPPLLDRWSLGDDVPVSRVSRFRKLQSYWRRSHL